MYIHNLSTRPSYENPCQHVGKINQKINPPYIPAANYNDQTAEYLLPRYITQQRTVDKSFKLHVPKTPSFGPVRKQRSPTQWQPRGSRNTQTRAKSSTLAFCSGSAATDSSAGAATRGKGCKGAGARNQARAPWHVQTFTSVLTRLPRLLPSEVPAAPPPDGTLCGGNLAERCSGSGDAANHAVSVTPCMLRALVLRQGLEDRSAPSG